MNYGPGERDMVVLRHEFVVEWDNRPSEKIVALLTSFGDLGGETAMARTVSLPAAVATRLLVEGDLDLTGVHVPVLPDLYVPVLQELEEIGVKFRESSHKILPGPFDSDSTD
jgi:saccharopine dehydrogenase-like NADP-dependent oxidoreductase